MTAPRDERRGVTGSASLALELLAELVPWLAWLAWKRRRPPPFAERPEVVTQLVFLAGACLELAAELTTERDERYELARAAGEVCDLAPAHRPREGFAQR